jgi:hypothetical protein
LIGLAQEIILALVALYREAQNLAGYARLFEFDIVAGTLKSEPNKVWNCPLLYVLM